MDKEHVFPDGQSVKLSQIVALSIDSFDDPDRRSEVVILVRTQEKAYRMIVMTTTYEDAQAVARALRSDLLEYQNAKESI